MTVSEMIGQYQAQNEDVLDTNMMLRWLKTIEQTIWNEIIATHEDEEGYLIDETGERIEDYFADFGMNKELLAESPHDDLYIYYIDMRWYQMNKETSNYNDAVTMFNSAYSTYRNWYNSQHMPKQKRPVFLKHRSLR